MGASGSCAERRAGHGLPLLALLIVLAGCQVPALTPPAQAQRDNLDGDYNEGWLYRKLTGQEQLQKPNQRPRETVSGKLAPSPDGQVKAASATLPASGGATQVQSDDVALQSLGSSLNGVKPEAIPDEEVGFDWSTLDPQNIYKNVRDKLGYGPNESLAQQYFREGEALYKEKQYAEAAKHFGWAAGRWPDSILEEDALFFQAESYFFADMYPKAHDTFLVLFKKYPNTRYLDTSARREFAIAQYWEQTYRHHASWPVTPNLTDKSLTLFDRFGNAMNAYNSVRINDPTGPLADDALMAMGNAYFAQDRFEDAAYNYDLLRREYPKSAFQIQAHVLGLQSKRAMYQGPLYDSAPLNDADEIAHQALTQFRGQLGDEQDRIQQAKREIHEQKAERELAAGWFYERKQAYGAARIYYRTVVNDYPGTHCAQWATERLEKIKEYPDNPMQPLKEVGKFFSTRKR